MKEENEGRPMGQVIKIDEARIRDHLGEMVRGTVEETLNAMLDAEADELCGAGRYQRSAERVDTRAGSYDRTLHTSAGEVKLKVPKLRQQVFETAIIERYRRREASVEESLIEMYLAGVSVRRVEDITEALWGTRVSPATVSNLNKKIYAKIEAWRNRADHGRASLSLPRRDRDEAQLGRRSSECLPAGGKCRQFRGFPGDPGDLRGGQGGQIRLVGLPPPPGRARPQGRPADHLGRLPRPCGKCRRVSARRPVAAVHGSFLPQCLQPCSGNQGTRREPHAEGDPCPGEPGVSRRRRPRLSSPSCGF